MSVALEITPAAACVSERGLRTLRQTLKQHIARGLLPGAVYAIARAGRVCCVEVLRGPTQPDLGADGIFRIYSMSKTFAGVVCVALAEQGRVSLDDPLARYLPEFGDMQVAVADDGEATRPAARPITLLDLLTHRAGFSGGAHGSPRICQLYREAGLEQFDFSPGLLGRDLRKVVSGLAKLPLAHQPGTCFEYGRSIDVLGAALQAATGTPYSQLLHELVTGPLALPETKFWVEPEQVARVARPSELDPQTPAGLVVPCAPPAYTSAGSGLLSTLTDLLRFLPVLVDGQGIVSPTGVAQLTCERLGPLIGTGPDYVPGEGFGFGLGLGVKLRTDRSGSAGSVFWLGRAATTFVVDRREQLSAVFLTQKYGQARHYSRLFRDLVYGALRRDESGLARGSLSGG